jgi:two-component system, NarL family, sensor histidine kinase UhpB
MHGTIQPVKAAPAAGRPGARGWWNVFSAVLRNDYSVAAYFAAFVTLVLIPVLVVVGSLEYRSALSERARIEQSAAQKARDITAEIDLNMVTRENLLTVLAGSYSLLNSDLETFYGQAHEVGEQLGIMIALRDAATGRRVFNTLFPWGSVLTPGNSVLEGDREAALRSGKPAVSDVFLASRSKHYLVAVTVPVIRGGETPYFLTMAFDASSFLSIFERLQVGENQVAMIVDRSGVVVARSKKNSEFMGHPFDADFLKSAEQAEGTASVLSIEGALCQYFFDRSLPTGWRVLVGVPLAALQAPMERAIRNVAITFGLLLCLGGAIAYAIGRRISRAIGVLRSAAIALEQHEAVTPAITNLRETNEAASAILAASSEMRRNAEQLRLAVDAAELGTWTWNKVTGEFSISERARSILRLPPTAECDPATFLERILPADRKVQEEILHSPVPGGHYEIEYRIQDPADRSIHWVSSRGRIEYDDTGTALRIQGVLRDITHGKKWAIERAELQLRLMRAQEEERLRLAHELHDRTGQSLTAIMMELKAVETELDHSGRDRLRRLREELDQMGRTLHRVAWELRPASINELGLTAALANYASEWSVQSGIEVDFHCSDPDLDRHSEEIRTTLYRVVQEALTNVVKHAAGATAASITINRTGSVLRLVIEDNGAGFDPSALGRHSANALGGLGLAGMRERLSLIGGELKVESSVELGTTIFVRIELQPQEAMA